MCTACHLDLRGQLGMRLFAVLTEADDLIAQMRAAARSPLSPLVPVEARPATMPTTTPVTRRPSGPRLATVPTVLLALGALCVLVAASLFLPFAWELLGVLGRTVVLIALTVAAAAAAHKAGDRGLRATAETLGVVSAGLLTFDLLGARSSGWFGDISDAGFATLLGAVLVAAGTGAALWMRRTRIGVFAGGEVVAVAGGAVLGLGVVGLDVGTLPQRLAVVVPLLGALALGTGSLRATRRGPDSMAIATYGHLAVVATAWAGLAASGVSALADGLSWAAMWPGGAGLTLLLTGVYAALPALDRRGSTPARAAWLSVALVPWTLTLTAPAYDEGATWRTSVVVAALLVHLVAAVVLSKPWRLSVLPVGLLSALASAMLVAPLAGLAATIYVEAVVPLWGATADARSAPVETAEWTGSWGAESLGSPWLLPVVALALALTLLVLAAQSGREASTEQDEAGRVGLSSLGVLGGTAVVLAVGGAMLLEAVPVWWVLALLLVSAATAGVAGWRASGRVDLHLSELVLGVAALVLSGSAEQLTLAACLALLPLAVAHHVRGTGEVRVGGGFAATLLLGGALWSTGALVQATATWTCLAVLVVTAVVAVESGLGSRHGLLGIESGAATVAVLTTAVGVEMAPVDHSATWLAAYLTVAGVATTLVALTRRERREVGWVGGLLLAAASWTRLADVGVSTPEAYTLPSAVALLVAGWWRTRDDAAAGTLSAWSPGLALALVPSLTWALADPLSLRALLLGLACFALAVAGAQRRLAAPLAWGAGVGAALVLWEVLPPAVEMSAWLVTGLAGAALLVLGASWERRVGEARSAFGYLRALR